MRMINQNRVMLFSLLALVAIGSCSGPESETEITVFAAASLTDVMQEIARDFEATTGIKANLNLASSGILARQIINGAPADVFVSANTQWMDETTATGVIDPSTVEIFAGNNLVVIAPEESEITLTQLQEIMTYPDISIAVGDPDHVPAGMYAREALERSGLWNDLSSTVIRALDVRAVLGYVKNREADLGFVYESDARIIEEIKILYRIPAELHSPIIYTSGLIAENERPITRKFLVYLKSPEAQEILGKYGFVKPDGK